MGKKIPKEKKIMNIKNEINRIIEQSKSNGEVYTDALLIPDMQQYLMNNGVSKKIINKLISQLDFAED